ncbi:MAG: hypothetical protein CSA81_06795 [Acidobacteria bacterium]|nr:MAG: hypothetical protein CSA81_06795 [Acidobacteriota bacterium]PIE90627.1 MAG: hypothetical protein CR997_05135 [Acidobacteriota bacterium]
MRKAIAILDILNTLLILALLASLVFPVYKTNRDKEGYAESVRELKSIAIALEKNYLETGAYPAFSSLADISQPDSILIAEGYLKEVPTTDYWGRKFKGTGDEKGYKLEGFGITSRSESIVRDHPDYFFVKGAKLKKKSKK